MYHYLESRVPPVPLVDGMLDSIGINAIRVNELTHSQFFSRITSPREFWTLPPSVMDLSMREAAESLPINIPPQHWLAFG